MQFLALDYFTKCASVRSENYLMGGLGVGVGADAAARNRGLPLDQLDPNAMAQVRRRGRALEAVGALGLGAIGGLGLAAANAPMGEWFDTPTHSGDTLHHLIGGATAGSFIGGNVLPGLGSYNQVSDLIEEKKRQKFTEQAAAEHAQLQGSEPVAS
jgi:hypothetical protein